jgi:hypothetical protein
MIRQSEYQTYVDLLGPGLVRQGDLTDPYYFDFISFSQYATINRDITQNPPMVFQEQQPMENDDDNDDDDQPMKFVPIVIKRDPSLTNSMLAPEHERRVGSMILNRLEELYDATDIAIPKLSPNSRPDAGMSSITVWECVCRGVCVFLTKSFFQVPLRCYTNSCLVNDACFLFHDEPFYRSLVFVIETNGQLVSGQWICL